jgi:AraC-like DNA-binding protein
MLFLQLIFTTGCIVTMLLIAGLASMDRAPSRSKRILVLLMISLSGLMISTLPAQFLAWGIVKAAANLISIPNVGLIWWLALSVFDDKFQIGKLAWTGMIAEISGPILMWLSYIGVIGRVPAEIEYVTVAIALVLVCHAIWVGIDSYRDDLIQPRREARVWIVSLVVLTLGVVLIAQVTTSGNVSGLLRVGIAFPVSILSLFWLVRFQTAILDFALVPVSNSEKLNIQVKDQVAYQKLLKIMTDDKPYVDPDLSIGGLALLVGVPAHQLRTIINQGMGFRNFSTFMSHYRITDIKPLLADPTNARTPILTIALSHGFSSISTFNRAFKNEVGQTASQFRSIAIEDD